VRSGREDDSFNWADKGLVGALNNPINFMNGWGKVLTTMRDSMLPSAGKNKGLIDVEMW